MSDTTSFAPRFMLWTTLVFTKKSDDPYSCTFTRATIVRDFYIKKPLVERQWFFFFYIPMPGMPPPTPPMAGPSFSGLGISVIAVPMVR